jgi:hypothetical protein
MPFKFSFKMIDINKDEHFRNFIYFESYFKSRLKLYRSEVYTMIY